MWAETLHNTVTSMNFDLTWIFLRVLIIMSFLRRLVAVRGDDDDEGEEGEALLEHEDYSSSESESSSNSPEDDVPIENGHEERE